MAPDQFRALLVARLHALLGELAIFDLPPQGDTVAAGDEFRELYLSVVPKPRPRSPQDRVGLPEIERDILEALGNDCLAAKELAQRAGYRLNSHFRGVLARMRRRGLLVHPDKGYARGPAADAPQGHPEGPALLFGQSLPQPLPASSAERGRKSVAEKF